MRDSKAEQWLDSHDVEWEYIPSVSIADIDLRDDAVRQVRMDGTDQHHLEDLRVQAAKDPNHLPAPLLANGADGDYTYRMLDGFTRTLAKKAEGHLGTDAYLLSAGDPFKLAMVQRTANITLNGKNYDRDERLAHGYYLHKKYSRRTIKEIAEAIQVPNSTLGFYIRIKDARLSMVARGWPEAQLDKLAWDHWRMLITHLDPVQDAFAELIIDANMDTVTAREVHARIDEASSEKAKLAVIAEEAKRHQDRKASGWNLLSNWKRAVRTVETQTKKLAAESNQLTAMERTRVADRARAASIALTELVKQVS